MACQESPARGFDGAFRDLYEQYKDRVYNVCYRTTGNAADALDASQETFGILFRKVSARHLATSCRLRSKRPSPV